MKKDIRKDYVEVEYARPDRPAEPVESFLSNARRTTGWQPIESAPRDGTEVLLFTDTQLEGSDWRQRRFYLLSEGEHFTAVQIGYWEDKVDAPMRREAAGWRCGRIGQPSHWMPLPAPPERLPEHAIAGRRR